jgi:hypothetical protein
MTITVPLADPGEFEIDNRLVGTWYGVSRCSKSDRGDFQPCQQSTGRPALLTTLQISVKPGSKELLVRGSALALDVGDFESGDRDFLAARVLHFEATPSQQESMAPPTTASVAMRVSAMTTRRKTRNPIT